MLLDKANDSFVPMKVVKLVDPRVMVVPRRRVVPRTRYLQTQSAPSILDTPSDVGDGKNLNLEFYR